LFFVDEKGRVYLRQDLSCPDDPSAIHVADALKYQYGMELWCGARCVKKYEGPCD
jgi:hypothetical protein